MKLSIPFSEFDFSSSRSGGPGGQHVNKVATKATLRWKYKESSVVDEGKQRVLTFALSRYINKSGEVVISSDQYRSLKQNQEACIKKLHGLVEASLKRRKKRIPTKPSRSQKESRLKSKKIGSEKKQNRKKVEF
jgi:ribosome-associated protein